MKAMKAKPKAKAKAKTMGKVPIEKKVVEKKRKELDAETKARNSRKSSAYHKARKEYVKAGFPEEVAKEKGREASWHATIACENYSMICNFHQPSS